MSTIHDELWKLIHVYPTTQMMQGEITAVEVAKRDAEWLYDQMVCDRRYDVDTVCDMLRLWDKERNKR